jgi:hypothetical protein
MWNPRQGEHSFIFRYTAEELCSVATEYDTSNEAAKLCPTLGSREATPSSDKEAPSDVVTHNTKKGAKGRKKRHKQHPQGATTITDYDDGNVKKTGGSDVGCVTTAMHSGKHQAQLPTHHFKRLLEEACPNHEYPVRHKLKDYDMMKSFMVLGSLPRGTKLDEDPGGSDMMPFPREDIVQMVYDVHPPPGRHHVSN